jgi:hypothetical protein
MTALLFSFNHLSRYRLQFQQLVIASGLGPCLPEATAQPRAMAVVVGRLGNRLASFVTLVRHEVCSRAYTQKHNHRDEVVRPFAEEKSAPLGLIWRLM